MKATHKDNECLFKDIAGDYKHIFIIREKETGKLIKKFVKEFSPSGIFVSTKRKYKTEKDTIEYLVNKRFAETQESAKKLLENIANKKIYYPGLNKYFILKKYFGLKDEIYYEARFEEDPGVNLEGNFLG